MSMNKYFAAAAFALAIASVPVLAHAASPGNDATNLGIDLTLAGSTPESMTAYWTTLTPDVQKTVMAQCNDDTAKAAMTRGEVDFCGQVPRH